MGQYIYLAVAVIVVVGIAIAVVVIRRRNPDDGLGGMTFADPADTADPMDAAERADVADPRDVADPAAPGAPAGVAALAGVADQAHAADPAGADGQEEVEQVLAVWRAENHHAGSNGGSEPPTPAEPPAAPDPGVAGAPAPAYAAAAAAYAAPVASQSTPVLGTAPGPGATAYSAGGNGLTGGNGSAGGNGFAAAALLADPIGVVLFDMAEGKGRLTGQELKRLEVFRPERIELAVDTIDLPPTLAGDDETLMRLAQIKLYASTLELRAKWAAQIPRATDGRLPEAPLTARDFKLKIARDIMALPTSDRSEVIGFLLGGLLSSNGSGADLKRAVIDTLEHLHSAALTNVLLDCLDDPDPIVQEYALAAADRLLGDA